MEHRNTISLGKFAIDFGLTGQQVIDEIASGRLGFSEQGGERFTDHFAVLDWAQRRALALVDRGAYGVTFPIFGCDIEFIEEVATATAKAEPQAATPKTNKAPA